MCKICLFSSLSSEIRKQMVANLHFVFLCVALCYCMDIAITKILICILSCQMNLLLKEYILSGDSKEAERCLRDLEVPHFHHEFVYEVNSWLHLM